MSVKPKIKLLFTVKKKEKAKNLYWTLFVCLIQQV